MSYCTQADIVRRIGTDDLVKLSDYDGDGSPDAAVVTQAIEDAQGDIDSYLETKFAVPVTPTPDVLRKHCVTMAIYYLQLGRDSVTEHYRKAYEDILKWLKDVVAGTATLGSGTTPAASPGAPNVRYDVQPRAFGRDKPL